MSQKNSKAAKAARSTARDRLRVERERQARRAKVRRQVVVGCAVAAVLAGAGGVSYAVMQSGKPSYWDAAKNDALVIPKHASGPDGTTVILGKSDARNTLTMYEDPRCPICAQFEQNVGQTVQKDVDNGTYRIRYIGATFIDGSNGEGSKNALSAMGAALNVSPDAFLKYKSALYSAAFHPAETDDKFKDDAYLIKVANTVDGLKDNRTFQKDVKDGTFDKWALDMSKKFDTNKDGVTGTPTLFMNGKKLVSNEEQNGQTTVGAPMTVAEFNAAVAKDLQKA